MAADLPISPIASRGGVLVHIGMHKTGTTAMQTLLAARRPELLARGVVFPGPRDDHHVQARALLQRDLGPGGVEKAPPPEVWSAFAAEVTAEEQRVVLSSEFFSAARDEQAVELVRDLGPGRVHVLVGVRNTVQSATAAWQQTLKQGRLSDIDVWARNAIPRNGRRVREQAFWEHWDLGAMVSRWVTAAGVEHMTVVVLDGADRNRLPATFEQLLGLEPGLLVDSEPPVSNRSMTAREAELVRRLNSAIRGELEWRDYRRIVRYGVIRSMIESRPPEPDEPRSVLPAWAQDELRAAGKRAAEEIRATGVRVVGDLDTLYADDERSAGAGPLDVVPVDVAVHAIVGAIRAERESGARRIQGIPAREMVQVLRKRLVRRAVRTVRREEADAT